MKKLNNFSRKKMYEIATFYANNEVTRSYFMKKYDISSSTFYSILKKSIIEHIVDLETVHKIKIRSLENTLNQCKDLSKKSNSNYYYALIDKRNNFLFSKTSRIKLIKDFVNRDKNISKSIFCKSYYIDVELFDKVLIQAIIYSEISNKLYLKLKNDSLFYYNNSVKVSDFFSNLEKTKKSISDYNITINVNNYYLYLLEIVNNKNFKRKDTILNNIYNLDDNGNLIIPEFDIIDEV